MQFNIDCVKTYNETTVFFNGPVASFSYISGNDKYKYKLYLTKCGQDKCLAECILGPSAKCSKCVCAKCRQTFRECMQVPCTIIPHNQWKCDDCPGSN